MSLLRERYFSEVRPRLAEQSTNGNPMRLPRLVKATLNMGLGEAVNDRKVVDLAKEELARISGQTPVTTLSRVSVAGFKIRSGWPIGCKVTLRRKKMWDFLDRLVLVALPRVRDFQGLSPRSFDGRGNYSLGISEQIVFPEIDIAGVDTFRGLDISIVTSSGDDQSAQALLGLLGFPFRKS